jgi:hypothetical protein
MQTTNPPHLQDVFEPFTLHHQAACKHHIGCVVCDQHGQLLTQLVGINHLLDDPCAQRKTKQARMYQALEAEGFKNHSAA